MTKRARALKNARDFAQTRREEWLFAENSLFDTLLNDLKCCDVGSVQLSLNTDVLYVDIHNTDDYEQALRYLRKVYDRSKEAAKAGKHYTVRLSVERVSSSFTLDKEGNVEALRCDTFNWPPPVRGSLEEVRILSGQLQDTQKEEIGLNRQFKESVKLLIEKESEGVRADMYEPNDRTYPLHVTLDPKRSPDWMAATSNRIEDLVEKIEEETMTEERLGFHLVLKLYYGAQRIRECTSRG